MKPANASIGFIGLGNMGGPMARRIVDAGRNLHGYDAAGTAGRIPVGGTPAGSIEDLVRNSSVVLLSLPDEAAVRSVAAEIASITSSSATLVIDLSTIGITAAKDIASMLADAGIDYLDAPVSGGVPGAASGSLAIMAAGPRHRFDEVQPLLSILGKNVFYMGDEAGQGQAMKLLNNFLSATALAATSEAVLFGLAAGLDMNLMLDVLNVSSGRNTATSDKFPQRVAPGKFDAGFATSLMTKDVKLYRDCVREMGSPVALCDRLASIWDDADRKLPGSDFTEIFCAIRDRRT